MPVLPSYRNQSTLYIYELVMLSFGDCSDALYLGANQDTASGDSVGKNSIYKNNKNTQTSLLIEVSGTNFYIWQGSS